MAGSARPVPRLRFRGAVDRFGGVKPGRRERRPGVDPLHIGAPRRRFATTEEESRLRVKTTVSGGYPPWKVVNPGPDGLERSSREPAQPEMRKGDHQCANRGVQDESPPGARVAHPSGQAKPPSVAQHAADDVLQHVARQCCATYLGEPAAYGTRRATHLDQACGGAEQPDSHQGSGGVAGEDQSRGTPKAADGQINSGARAPVRRPSSGVAAPARAVQTDRPASGECRPGTWRWTGAG